MSPGDGRTTTTSTAAQVRPARACPTGGSGDVYGGAARRPARSSSRSLITVVGVVVLLIAAIAFANRGGCLFGRRRREEAGYVSGGDGSPYGDEARDHVGVRP